MSRSPSRSRHVYMDDRFYRSAQVSSPRYDEMIVDRRTPRFSPVIYDDRPRTSYFDRALGDDYDRQIRSPYSQDFYGYDMESRCNGDEFVRRINREAALANNAIEWPSANVQLHPMATLDGRYPPSFSVPRRLSDFVQMTEWELESILAEYEVGSSRRRHYRGSLVDRFDDHDPFYKSNSSRLRDLIALFEFLGAYRLVKHLRRRS